jgi:cell wall-associated NlpC family hydrolase
MSRWLLASRSGTALVPRVATPAGGFGLAIARRQAWTSAQRRRTDLPINGSPSKLTTELASGGTAELVSEEENEQLIREALAARGTRYRWGGASRGGFDCSGFTRYLFLRHAGLILPHSASAQSRLGQKITRDQLQPGDLLFFRTYRRGISHVGLYVGDNKFVHAANTRSRVRVDSMNEAYYDHRYVTARRIRDPAQKAAPPPKPPDVPENTD